MGINPTNDGSVLRIAFPQLTEERRRELVKDIHKLGEDAKVAIRSIRRDTIEKFKSMLKQQEQMGRKFDFLAQELFREINTITSKSNNSAISHLSVDVKNYIDKIREHCRNIV